MDSSPDPMDMEVYLTKIKHKVVWPICTLLWTSDIKAPLYCQRISSWCFAHVLKGTKIKQGYKHLARGLVTNREEVSVRYRCPWWHHNCVFLAWEVRDWLTNRVNNRMGTHTVGEGNIIVNSYSLMLNSTVYASPSLYPGRLSWPPLCLICPCTSRAHLPFSHSLLSQHQPWVA